MTKKTKLLLWIPYCNGDSYVELYNENGWYSEALYSLNELKEEIKFWKDKGYNTSEAEKTVKENKYLLIKDLKN